MKKNVRMISAVMSAVMMFSAGAVPVCADWQETDVGKIYLNKNNEKVTGFRTIDGKTYYFNEKGIMQTGMIKLLLPGETEYYGTYYFKKNGELYTGWLKTKSGKMMYFYPAEYPEYCYAAQYSAEIGGKTYGFDENGYMFTYTGWAGNGYYRKDYTFAENCRLKINGKTYIFNDTKMGVLKELAEKDPSELKLPDLGKNGDEEFDRCGVGKMYGDWGFGLKGTALLSGKKISVFGGMTGDDRTIEYFGFWCGLSETGEVLNLLEEKFGEPISDEYYPNSDFREVIYKIPFRGTLPDYPEDEKLYIKTEVIIDFGYDSGDDIYSGSNTQVWIEITDL